ncbi:YdaU family protein [Azohydromonas lata]|uniref:YdaU family protein n=1 Tax=Azohydromonas lata TaxID=45677 RepID=A0ABU5ICX6_9BURK|nr:YdaU family protein [Azohydromonas lata]MDZ5456972.1 YdaU family protein [Azohydromonas lata]
MNYFPFHLGDYAAATLHLSLIEDALLCRMLRRYYLDEKPLPADVAEVARRVGARNADELQAVDLVLREFFTLTPDGWRQARADREIAAYRAAAERGRAGAKARWEQSELLDDLSTGVPGNANQEPGTKNQKPAAARRVDKAKKAKATPAMAEAAGAVCEVLRAVGLNDADPQEPLLHELLASGVTAQDLVAVAVRAGHADHPFRYTLKAAKGRISSQPEGRECDLLTLYGHTVIDAGAADHARTQDYLSRLLLSDDQRAKAQAEARRIREELSLGKKSKKEPADVAC